MAPKHDAARPATEARRRARAQPGSAVSLTEALGEVTTKLDAAGLAGGERMRLLQRQAELGDLRDELAQRERRRTGQQG
jgi:hypothetical protein